MTIPIEREAEYLGDIQHRLACLPAAPKIEPEQPISPPAPKAETKPAKAPEPLPLFAEMSL